ncbi:hypothetical protein B0H10DRAFT_1976856 [Mycena sp. CBHHK59/15]|nr:hypothetical protein B0H10DRAFT_1976856 [Mycena sp. CBHHK59/15]
MSSPAKLINQGIIVSRAIYGRTHPGPDNVTAVLDAATGTTGWLGEVAPLLPTTVELHGIDISDAKFPQPAEYQGRQLPLGTHDLTEPIPGKYHAKFDLINVRRLFGWLDYRKWDAVYRNLLVALKPGGYIQVLDTRMTIKKDFDAFSPRMKKKICRHYVHSFRAECRRTGHHRAAAPSPDDATREAGMLQMLGSARAFRANGVGVKPDGEVLSGVIHDETYTVPKNHAEWEAFIEESKKSFEEEGWGLPLRVTIAQRPL